MQYTTSCPILYDGVTYNRVYPCEMVSGLSRGRCECDIIVLCRRRRRRRRTV